MIECNLDDIKPVDDKYERVIKDDKKIEVMTKLCEVISSVGLLKYDSKELGKTSEALKQSKSSTLKVSKKEMVNIL